MKIITKPIVTLIAKQTFIGHPDYQIPSDGNDATKIGAFAAKGCYDSFGENGRANEANQLAILEHQHGSVLEHITFTLFIEGITRALSLESNRHRQLAVSQRSTRYTAEEDSAIVLEPYYADIYENKDSASPEQEDLLNAFLASCEATIMDYQDQVEILMKLNPLELKGFDLRKWARGKARNILPHALETRITYTGNVRAWRWFIESRSDKHAEPEIRRLADSILTVLRTEAPIYFNDFKVSEVYDGMPVWVPYYHKV